MSSSSTNPQKLFGIGTYQPVNATGTLYSTGMPSAGVSFTLQNPFTGMYGGTYGYVVDTGIRAPKRVALQPATEIGLDNTGLSVVRGYPSMTWTYDTLRPDYWYYLHNLWALAQRTPPGFQSIVLIQYPLSDGTNTPIYSVARWDPPTHSNRDVGAYYNIVLTFRYMGLYQVPPGSFIQVL